MYVTWNTLYEYFLPPLCLQELGIKNPLHRKKLQLAIKAISTKQTEKSAELDFIWVTRKFWHETINEFHPEAS